jgi:hypothetical protein
LKRNQKDLFPAGAIDSDEDDPLVQPNDNWLKSVDKELQVLAMREWFFARYEDPQNQTPYDSEEGQYIFIWGGPYDPRNELTDRF